jgi:hypothetical protein
MWLNETAGGWNMTGFLGGRNFEIHVISIGDTCVNKLIKKTCCIAQNLKY